MAHKLYIEIHENETDLNYLSVADKSLYDTDITVTNPVLKVRLPGEDEAVILTYVPESETSYNSVTLNYTATEPICLPDGIWEFTYSVCPNEEVYYKLRYFRVANLEWSIRASIAKLSITDRELEEIDDCGNIKLDKERHRLLNLLFLLEGIKANASENPVRAVELYKHAKKQYEKFTKSDCKYC